MLRAIRNMLLVLLAACIVVGVVFPSFGIGLTFVLFWLSIGLFYAVSAVATVMACVIWLGAPLLVCFGLVKLADLTTGPLLAALHWWAAGAYGLMGVLLAGMLAATWPISQQMMRSVAEDYHFLLWLGPMLLALLPAWVGFQRWQKKYKTQ